jgi:hypothetical protein
MGSVLISQMIELLPEKISGKREYGLDVVPLVLFLIMFLEKE